VEGKYLSNGRIKDWGIGGMDGSMDSWK